MAGRSCTGRLCRHELAVSGLAHANQLPEEGAGAGWPDLVPGKE